MSKKLLNPGRSSRATVDKLAASLMVTLFRATMRQGFVRAFGRGGAAVTSASAPGLRA